MKPIYERDQKTFNFITRKGNHFENLRVYWTNNGTHYHVWLNKERSGSARYHTKRRFELLVALSGRPIEKLTYDFLPEPKD